MLELPSNDDFLAGLEKKYPDMPRGSHGGSSGKLRPKIQSASPSKTISAGDNKALPGADIKSEVLQNFFESLVNSGKSGSKGGSSQRRAAREQLKLMKGRRAPSKGKVSR